MLVDTGTSSPGRILGSASSAECAADAPRPSERNTRQGSLSCVRSRRKCAPLFQERHHVLEAVLPRSTQILNSQRRHGEVEAALDVTGARCQWPCLPYMSTFTRRCHTPCCVLADCMRCMSGLRWPEHGCTGWGMFQLTCRCCTTVTRPGKRLRSTCWRSEITTSERTVRASIGTASSVLMWPCRASFPCSPYGIITEWLLMGSMRALPPSSGRDRSHPIHRGWQLWALQHVLPDCSNVSYAFEACLRGKKRRARRHLTILTRFFLALMRLSCCFRQSVGSQLRPQYSPRLHA